MDSSEELCDQPRLVLDLHSTDHVGCLGHEIFLTKEKILVCAVSAAEDAFIWGMLIHEDQMVSADVL